MKNSINAKSISKDMTPFLNGSKGVIHSVFHSAINVLLEDRMITLLGKSRGALPYSILLKDELALEYLGLSKDDFVIIDEKGIHTEKLFIDIEPASFVDLNIVSSLRQLKKPDDFGRILKRFAIQICRCGSKDGLSVLLFDDRLPHHLDGEYCSNIWSEFLSERIKRFLMQLESVMNHKANVDTGTFVEWGKCLAGCGPGLTPGSDDFITGIFAGLYAKGLSGEIPVRTVDKICKSVSIGAAQKTNFISGQFLKQSGQERLFAEDVIKLIKAIYAADFEGMKQAAINVGGFGSTSGSEIMTGIYFAMALSMDTLYCANLNERGGLENG